MTGFLQKALNLRREEVLPATLLFSYLFFSIAGYTAARAVARATFATAFRDYVPHAIAGTALFIGVFVSIYIRLSHRLRMERLITGTLLFFSAAFVGLVVLAVTVGKWAYPPVWALVYASGVMGPTMGWTLGNYVLTTREARRVFGFMGAGAISGGIFGPFLAPLATKFVRVEMVLLVPAVLFAVNVVLVTVIFRRVRDRLAGLDVTAAAGIGAPRNFRQSLALILSSRYLTLIMLLIAIGSIVTTIIGDYQFVVIAADYFKSHTPDQDAAKKATAAFFGTFDGFTAIASLLFQLVLTGRLLRTFGIRVTLFVLPVTFILGSAAVLWIPTLITASVLKGSQNVFRYSLDKSSTELLYLPVAPDIKNQVKSFVDTFIWRAADGVAGVVLWVFTNKIGFSPSRISLVNLAFLGAWIAIAWGVRREYLNVLRRAIERRTLDPERTAAGVLDSSTMQVLALAIERGDEQQILYALSLFELGRATSWHPTLRTLLEHPSPAVRQRALRLLSDAGDREITAKVEKMVRDPSAEVSAEALHYLVIHAGRDPISLLGGQTDVPDYSLQGSVVAYLARSGKPENFAAAELILEGMVAEEDEEGAREGADKGRAAQARAEAARVLGVIPPPSELHAVLPRLLRDKEPEVVEQALASAGKIQGREYLPLVIEKLGDKRLVAATRAALIAYGERAVGTLQDYLNDEAVPLSVRKQIPGVLARIPTPESISVLTNSLIQSDAGLRFDVVKALNKIHRRDATLVYSGMEVENMLMAELMGYYRSFQILAAVDPRAATARRAPATEAVLVRALRERMDHELERIFRLLGLLYPARDIHNAYVGLNSSRPHLEANALEVLEHILKPDMYRMLAYTLDPEIPMEEKLTFARQFVRSTVDSKADALRMLLRSEDRWLSACALHEIGDLRLTELADDVKQAPHADPLLEETWTFATARLAA